MCALPREAERSRTSPAGRVIGCERVEVSARSVLVRVTVELGDAGPQPAADAELVVLIDGTRERRQRALPASADARADTGATMTLGFAVTGRAQILGLELGGQRLELPVPVVRSSAAAALAAPAGGAPAPAAPRAPLDSEAHPMRARLAELRATAARLEAERDSARRAAARAEAAAHDVTARAEAAAHDATARVEALAAAVPPGSSAARPPLRRPRRAVLAACSVGSAALVCGTLVWPGGDAANRGVSDVAASQPAAAGLRTPVVFDALAERLQIPSSYLVLYRQAGARYGLDWTRLAAIGAIESRHGQSAEAGVSSGANRRGASGPAQFLAGTWERFGVDGDGDGTRDPHDPSDAIAAMASYLRASGAPQDWRAALRTYNRSDAYVTAVENLAATYRRDAD